MEKVLMKTEQRMPRGKIAESLRKISEGLEKGDITLSSGGEEVNLKPTEEPEFEIKVEEEGDEISLELEIEWNPEKEEKKEVEIS